MSYIKYFFRLQLKTATAVLLLFSVMLLLSCSDDDNNTPPAPNYDGVGSVELNYSRQQPRNPQTVEAIIYDQDDNTLFAEKWQYDDFKALLEDSEDNPIIFSDIPAGPQHKLLVLVKDRNGGVVSRGEKETFSLTASESPVVVEVKGESFTPVLVSPMGGSASTKNTLPSFEWELEPEAEKYRITVNSSTGPAIFSKITEDNTVPASEALENITLNRIIAKPIEPLRPFQDTGQDLFFSDTSKITTSKKETDDYYGQDAHFGKNSQSYTAIQHSEDESFAVSNTIKKYTWKVTAIDAYGNESTHAEKRNFAIVWQMVHDNVTGLTWEVKTKNDDSIHDMEKLYTPQEANNLISNLNQMEFGGYSDWRIPTIKELSSIIRKTYVKLDAVQGRSKVYFPNAVSASYRSSTLLAYYSTPHEKDISAWHADFTDGSVFEENRSLRPVRVRAVRGETIEQYYTDNGDGTVTDTAAKLMWTKEVPQDPMTWKAALKYCIDLDLIYTDWRLPNRNELQSLVDYSRNTSFDTAAIAPVFTESDTVNIESLPQYYWTSTTTIFKPTDAYIVSFIDGSVTHTSKAYADNVMVRAVRDAQ